MVSWNRTTTKDFQRKTQACFSVLQWGFPDDAHDRALEDIKSSIRGYRFIFDLTISLILSCRTCVVPRKHLSYPSTCQIRMMVLGIRRHFWKSSDWLYLIGGSWLQKCSHVPSFQLLVQFFLPHLPQTNGGVSYHADAFGRWKRDKCLSVVRIWF